MGVQVFLFIRSVQNECVAGIEDTVQRGLGMLPQQAKIPGLLAEKTKDLREPVQVYTACQFVIITFLTVSFYCIISVLQGRNCTPSFFFLLTIISSDN